MHKEYLPKNPALTKYARELRRNATPSEKKLWYQFLSTYPVRFNRQRIILNYIVDFYCPRARLVIELDGEGHFLGDAPEYDAARTAALEGEGLYVFRVSNYELGRNFKGVCAAIDALVQDRIEQKLP